MKRMGWNLIGCLAAALLALSTAPAWANITSVAAVPASANVAVGRSTTVTVTWRVTADSTCGLGLHTVSSPQGVLVTTIDGGGRPVVRALSGTYNVVAATANVSTVLSFTETFSVPADVVDYLHRGGAVSMTYRRIFTETYNNTVCDTNSGSMTLNFTGSAGAGFSVDRLSLRFDDDSTVRLLARDSKLAATADVTFAGSGLLAGVWEIADPSSTLGTPVFRPLTLVRQQLAAGGRVTLHSPALPTDRLGLYLLRLRITDPQVPYETPMIRYFVMNEADMPRPPAPMNQTAPDDNSSVGPQTEFGWTAIDSAKLYQLEVYPMPAASVADGLPDLGGGPALETNAGKISGPPLTGMVVPAERTRTVLSVVTLGHLRSGESYLWRVLALDDQGRVVGASPLRRLKFQ
jgi:hypothetical protein